MNLPAVVLIVTEDCNFRCKYCYQAKRKHYMTWHTAKQTLDFFLPRLKKDYGLTFTGGEPLLALDLLKKAVSYLESKNREQAKSPTYAVVTNGSLIDDSSLDFFNRYGFTIALSFDGYGQNSARKKNSFNKTAAVIKKALQLENITLNVNSTFSTATVANICRSMEFIMELGVKQVSLSLDLAGRWNRPSLEKLAAEIANLEALCLEYYKKNGTIPVTLFRERSNEGGIWRCAAGINQLTVTPGGHIWGCPCFFEYFKERVAPAARDVTNRYSSQKKPSQENKFLAHNNLEESDKYYFGRLEDFAKNYKKTYRRILANYSPFRMDNYYTANSRCFLCPLVEKCGVCPVLRAESRRSLLYVQPYICAIKKILINARDRFQAERL